MKLDECEYRKLFGLRSQFLLTQPGDTEMLADAFDGVLRWLVFDTNGEYSIDNAEGEVVVSVLFFLGEVEVVCYWINEGDFEFRSDINILRVYWIKFILTKLINALL